MVINEELKSILNRCDTKKVIATQNEKGEVHVTFKNMIFIDENNMIILLEMLERSVTNQNLVHSIWFNKSVAINFLSKNNESFYFQVLPKRAIVSGKMFEKYYKKIQVQMGDVDLSTVWMFEILDAEEKTLMKQVAEQKMKYPIINHLDRLMVGWTERKECDKKAKAKNKN